MKTGISDILMMICQLAKSKGVIVFSTDGNIYPYFTKINQLPQDISEKLANSIGKLKDVLTDSELLNKVKKECTAKHVHIYSFGKQNSFNILLFNDIKAFNFEEIIPALNYLENQIVQSDVKNELYNRFLETIENISTTIYSSDKNASHYYFVSSAVEKLIGVKAEEIYTQRYLLFRSILPQDFSLFKQFIRKINRGQYAEVDYRFIDIGGNIKIVRHSGTPIIEDGEVVRIVGMIKDITTEKMIIDQLSKSEEKLNLLLSTTNALIFSLDRSGYFVSVNTRGTLELGYNQSDLLGKHFLEFIDEEFKAEIAIAFQKILTTDETVEFEAHFVDSFGKIIIYQVQAKSIREDGKIVSMLGIASNITFKKKDEDKLNELNSKLTEANRIISIERDRAKHQITVLEELDKLKNDFIANVSHELRTPLASIVGFAETITSDDELPREVVLEFANIILTEGKRLAKLVNDILDFSKLESNKEKLNISTIDIINLIKDLHSNYNGAAIEKKIEFTTELPEAEIIVECDRDRISKAIGNLISNAIKFTKADGRVTIVAQDFLKEVEILVNDTGVGIPEDQMPKLFEKFSKTDSGGNQSTGAGFGLASVKQIIDLHSGLIQVSSEPGMGSTFIIRLPKKVK